MRPENGRRKRPVLFYTYKDEEKMKTKTRESLRTIKTFDWAKTLGQRLKMGQGSYSISTSSNLQQVMDMLKGMSPVQYRTHLKAI